MKKTLLASLLILAALSVTSCSNNPDNSSQSSGGSSVTEPSGSNQSSSQGSSVSSSEEEASHELTIAVNGNAVVRQTVSFAAYVDGTALLPAEQNKVNYSTEDTDLLTLDGNKATLIAEGKATVTASYTLDGTALSTEFTIEIEASPIKTVAEARALAKNNEYVEVVVQGVITATSGSSAFLADSTGGIYIYNWYFQQTDTAPEHFNWVLGSTVEVSGFVTAYYDAPQLVSSYNDGSQYVNPSNPYANLVEEEIDPGDPIVLDEDGVKNLTSQSTGRMYTITGKYVDGAPTNVSREYINFEIGNTSFSLRTDGSKTTIYDDNIDQLIEEFEALDLVAGDEVTITAPLYEIGQTGTPNFFYASQGVTLQRANQVGFVASYSGETRVGETLTLSARYNGAVVSDVNYEVTTGADLVSIEGNEVTLNSVGDVVITASYTPEGGEEVTDTIEFTIEEAIPVSAIKDIKDGEEVNVKGVVLGEAYDGVLIGDAAGKESKVYIYFGTSNAALKEIEVGDYLSVTGTPADRYGNLQFSSPDYEILPEDEKPAFVDEPVDWTDENLASWDGTIGDYVTLSGIEVTISGNYINFSYGSVEKGSIKTSTGVSLEEGFYDVTGYMLDINGGDYRTILVTSAQEAEQPTGVYVDPTEATIEVGKTVQLNVETVGLENTAVNWSVAEGDETIASVNETGLVTGLDSGDATIIATSESNPDLSASAVITVIPALPEGETITVTFDSDFNKDFETISSEEWSKTVNGVRFTNSKAESTTNIALADDGKTLSYCNPLRLYKSSTFKIEAPEGRKILAIATTSISKYEFNSTNVSSSVGVVSDGRVTCEEGVSELVLTAKNQFRLDYLDIILAE